MIALYRKLLVLCIGRNELGVTRLAGIAPLHLHNQNWLRRTITVFFKYTVQHVPGDRIIIRCNKEDSTYHKKILILCDYCNHHRPHQWSMKKGSSPSNSSMATFLTH